MKKAIVYISTVMVLMACGADKEQTVESILETNDLTEIRKKRIEIVAQQSALTLQLQQLDGKIAELDTNKKTPLITAVVVKEERFHHYLEFQGNVSTKNLLVIYPEFAGLLSQVNVKEGDRVIKGQVLAKIDDGGLSQQLGQMEIQLTLAKTTFERQERLWKDKIGSELQFLQAKASYEGQEKMVNQLKEQINKTFVKAPFTGVVDEVITEQGALVSPGQSQLIRIINLDHMYIETAVPESYLATVTKDKVVEVEFPVIGRTITTKVGQVANYINPANRTFKIEVPLPNIDHSLRPNLTAKLKINDYTSEKAIMIPQSIISENAEGQQYIYIVKNKRGQIGTAQRVIITTGKTQGDVVEVLEGVNNGDEIVKEGARSIQDGQEVKILTH